MKILAVSDIHGNVRAVRQVRARERNEFDAVVVAGDIGSGETAAILGILASFECPVLYVYGNWDHNSEYDKSFGHDCHHLHLTPWRVQDVTFIGYSGVDANWGRNPFALSRRCADVGRANRRALARAIAKCGYDAQSMIVVTHDRLYRTAADMPDIPLFLFGHRHGFYDREFKGSRFVNVSVLDRPVSVERPSERRKKGCDGIFNINDGTYTIIEMSRPKDIVVRSKAFRPSFDGWDRLDDIFVGRPWVGDSMVDQSHIE
jgi:predicted phosphodiesterase